jgi:hypothetical protein
VIINGKPVGSYCMLTFYLVATETINEYGYVIRGRAFLKVGIGYIRVYRHK